MADAYIVKIDPWGLTHVFSTYIGGGNPFDFDIVGGADWGLSIALDSNRDIYICGLTESDNFPVTPNAMQPAMAGGLTDAFLCKVSNDGQSLLYSSYVGGSVSDFGWGLAIDAQDRPVMVGYTGSPNFPVTLDSMQPMFGGGNVDGFVVRFDLDAPGGPIIDYGTYFGFGGTDEFFDIHIDPTTGVYSLIGNSDSTANADTVVDDPMKVMPQAVNGGLSDIIVVQLSPDGAGASDLRYFTYLGGTDRDSGIGITRDDAGHLYLSGFSFSADFPTVNAFLGYGGSADIVLTCLDPSGAGGADIDYSTVCGLGLNDVSWDVKHFAGDTFFVGSVTFGVTQQAFVMRLTSTGVPVGADIFGGFFDDFATAIDISEAGMVVVGYSACSNDQPFNENCVVTFPVLNAIQPTYGGGAGDAFVRFYTDF